MKTEEKILNILQRAIKEQSMTPFPEDGEVILKIAVTKAISILKKAQG